MPLARNSAALKQRAWLNGPTLPPAYLSMNRFARSALNQRSGNYVCNCPIVNQGDGCTTITELDFTVFANQVNGVWAFKPGNFEIKECEILTIPEGVTQITLLTNSTMTIKGEFIIPADVTFIQNGIVNNFGNTVVNSGVHEVHNKFTTIGNTTGGYILEKQIKVMTGGVFDSAVEIKKINQDNIDEVNITLAGTGTFGDNGILTINEISNYINAIKFTFTKESDSTEPDTKVRILFINSHFKNESFVTNNSNYTLQFGYDYNTAVHILNHS